MSNAFITGHNLTDYMKEAINIYVASNYLSRAVIDDIKANLNQLPFRGGKNFRFLLNQDFHEDPSMRKILINMLLELPNTEVRIYKGERRFHAKLYIFESGNQVSTAIGSFNATLGGSGRNIEAGVRSKDREIYKEAKYFFDKYWDSEETEIAQYDKNALFIQKKFQPGDSVVIRSTQEHGVILNEEPALVNKEWEYCVFINGFRRSITESQLSHLEIATYWTEKEFLSAQKGDYTFREWIRNYVLEKALDLTDRTLASLQSSRTEIYHYQFRPLFKILQSRYHRLLIADEVGLGKTIEAGIIIKELQSRIDLQRILIVVPNSLKTKWRDELAARFDEYYDILSANKMHDFLDDYVKSTSSAAVKGIISYDQLVTRSIRDKLKKMSDPPAFDIIVIDEAHHLKNQDTRRYEVLSRLTACANAVIMLTATPIQLATKDLYNIMNLLLPGTYISFDPKSFSARLTVNERINDAIKKLKKRSFGAFKEIIAEVASKRGLRKHIEHYANYQAIIESCQSIADTADEKEINDLARELFNLNILNQYITRTLRKDVALSFPDRVVQTYEYEYTEEEKIAYDAILQACRMKYSSRKSALSMIMPERRAASSIIAMLETAQHESWDEMSGEYEDNVIEMSDDDEDGRSTSISKELGRDLLFSFRGITMPENDSKLDVLKAALSFILAEEKNDSEKKVIIFCTFRATIAYLKDRLQAEFPYAHVDTITGEDDMYLRDEKRRRFSENDSPKILVCSEVAGEGLDFQFCHYLVNYDMPWNPAKLEQRVGRIDRIGQKSERVTIINLVNKYTVEDHIMARLFERVKLFNSTIGPLGDILSRYQKEFVANTLKSERTQEEKEKYERNILANIERIKKEQEQFEEKQVELYGVLDHFHDEIREKRTYFTAEEIWLIWEEYLREYRAANHGLNYLIRDHDDVFFLKVDADVKAMLIGLVKRGIDGKSNKRKRDHYLNRISVLEEKKLELKYTFAHACALRNLAIEYLNISHPFIKGALYYLQNTFRSNKDITACRGRSTDLKPGEYLIFVYRFNIVSVRDAVREYVDERIFIYNVEKEIGYWDSEGKIIQDLIRHSSERPEIKHDFSRDLESKKNYIEGEKKKMANEILNLYMKMNNSNQNLRKQTLSNYYDNKISDIRDQLKYVHEPLRRNQLEGDIRELECEKAEKLGGLDQNDFRIIVRCTGIINLEVA